MERHRRQRSGVGPRAHLAELQPDDVLLLCTDGLTKGVDEAEIAHVLGQSHDAQDMCQRLVTAANGAGGHDNVTTVVARFLPVAAPLPASEQTVGSSSLRDTAPLPEAAPAAGVPPLADTAPLVGPSPVNLPPTEAAGNAGRSAVI